MVMKGFGVVKLEDIHRVVNISDTSWREGGREVSGLTIDGLFFYYKHFIQYSDQTARTQRQEPDS